MPVQKPFPQVGVGGGGRDRNLALLCLVASGGITAGAPGLQDDSALLAFFCLLCYTKWIFLE